ncbi:MAG TPA: A/G-specific adenine glycosylase [Verrucomicrobia bacterium]|nr:A/G-specific adenine glycosylase [Verrucomicrobiota bacterium]
MNQTLRTRQRGAAIRRTALRLLDWFDRHARDLPWRRTRDPYAIWVSEIMLQQTQVKTVIPYWTRWMRRLPTLRHLARARASTIHKLWEGLGYYTRVRNLQKAAKVILTRHGGRFPETFDDVLALPGVGRYTAGAICSIAFNQPTPVLDGNVIRVLTRVFGIAGDPRTRTVNARLWTLAEDLVIASRDNATRGRRDACSRLNQSLMELGALVCTPRQPDCGACPLAAHCFARRQGRIEDLPNLRPRPAATRRRFAAFVVHSNGRYLVRRRPEDVVNGHLWEFPNIELNGGSLETAARACLRVKTAAPRPLCTIRHSITRYRITLDAFTVEPEGPLRFTEGRWLTLPELKRLSFPSAHRRILEQLNGVREPRSP